MSRTFRLPLDLPRLVMRRAGLVAGVSLCAAIVLGFVRASIDIDDETRAAESLAEVMRRVATLDALGDAEAIAALQALQREEPLRHLSLSIVDVQGRMLLAPQPEPADGIPLSWLVALHRRWAGEPASTPVSWTIPRAGEPPWTVSLAASPGSERRESMADVVSLLVVLSIGGGLMLAVMAWNVHRAFRPLASLLVAIGDVERGDPSGVLHLPEMPIRELQAIAAALRRLGGALEAAEAERRLLGQKVLNLQEDERHRIARELHDEFGQRLTALRVDAAWLQRRLHGQAEMLRVVDGMVTHCEGIQRDIRDLLARLQPLGPAGLAVAEGSDDAARDEPPQRLRELLQSLADGWKRSGGHGVELRFDDDAAPAVRLPQRVVLALYRISQEALTNVARHAGATRATLSLRIATAGEGATQIDWAVEDDGRGLSDAAAALRRGSGLAGIKERVWALGGDLAMGRARTEAETPGLRLAARMRLDGAGGAG